MMSIDPTLNSQNRSSPIPSPLSGNLSSSSSHGIEKEAYAYLKNIFQSKLQEAAEQRQQLKDRCKEWETNKKQAVTRKLNEAQESLKELESSTNTHQMEIDSYTTQVNSECKMREIQRKDTLNLMDSEMTLTPSEATMQKIRPQLEGLISTLRKIEELSASKQSLLTALEKFNGEKDKMRNLCDGLSLEISSHHFETHPQHQLLVKNIDIFKKGIHLFQFQTTPTNLNLLASPILNNTQSSPASSNLIMKKSPTYPRIPKVKDFKRNFSAVSNSSASPSTLTPAFTFDNSQNVEKNEYVKNPITVQPFVPDLNRMNQIPLFRLILNDNLSFKNFKIALKSLNSPSTINETVDGWTPLLLMMTLKRNINFVTELIKHYPCLTATVDGWNAAQLFVLNPNMDLQGTKAVLPVITHFVTHSPELFLGDSHPAFHIAAYYGHHHMMKALIRSLDKWADAKTICLINQLDSQGMAPIHYAAKSKHRLFVLEAIYRLSSKIDINVGTKDESLTPLMLAAREGIVENVNQLLAFNGIRINQQDSQGKTALDHASNRECTQALQAKEGLRYQES